MELVPVSNFQQVQKKLGNIPCSVRAFTEIGNSETIKMEDDKSGYEEAENMLKSVKKWQKMRFEGLECDSKDENPHYEDIIGNILYPFQTSDHIVLRYSLDNGKTPIKDNKVDSGSTQRVPDNQTNLVQSGQADGWEIIETHESGTNIQTSDDEDGVKIEIVDSGLSIPSSAHGVRRIYVFKCVNNLTQMQ